MYWKGLLLAPCSAMSLASSFFKKGARASLREGDKEEEKEKEKKKKGGLKSCSVCRFYLIMQSEAQTSQRLIRQNGHPARVTRFES